MLKKWLYFPKKSNDVIKQLLINRKISKKEQKSFLQPSYDEDFFDPFKMKNMKKAVIRIEKALQKNEKIAIFGDYDADGIPGTVLVYEALKKIGIRPTPFISKRSEGYGLNIRIIKRLIKQKYNLVICVDNGTKNVKEINYAKNKNLDFIICDHHETGKILPKAILLNPKQKKCNYPFKELCGAGVVYKLTQALSKRNQKITERDLKWWLELAAISTICDVVPLVGENRVIAYFGLLALKKTKRIGLQEIYKIAGIDQSGISTYTVGFQIGPRLNAPGRLNMANESFWLLATKNINKAKKLAITLEKANQERQKKLLDLLEKAEKKIISNQYDKKKIILVSGKNWPSGLIGLVAGKITEKYSRPTIILSKGKKISKGSARSIDNFHIIEALENSKKYLKKFGGHSKAAGLTLENERLEDLYNQLLKLADFKLTSDDLIPKIRIDLKLNFNIINMNLINKINRFEPYGLGNPRPVFSTSNLEIIDKQLLGKEKKHLKIKIKNQDGIIFSAIGFNLGEFNNQIKISDIVDLAYSIDTNEWMGEKRIELRLIDLKIV